MHSAYNTEQGDSILFHATPPRLVPPEGQRRGGGATAPAAGLTTSRQWRMDAFSSSMRIHPLYSHGGYCHGLIADADKLPGCRIKQQRRIILMEDGCMLIEDAAGPHPRPRPCVSRGPPRPRAGPPGCLLAARPDGSKEDPMDPPEDPMERLTRILCRIRSIGSYAASAP